VYWNESGGDWGVDDGELSMGKTKYNEMRGADFLKVNCLELF
jgi:hypothetical protein